MTVASSGSGLGPTEPAGRSCRRDPHVLLATGRVAAHFHP